MEYSVVFALFSFRKELRRPAQTPFLYIMVYIAEGTAETAFAVLEYYTAIFRICKGARGKLIKKFFSPRNCRQLTEQISKGASE